MTLGPLALFGILTGPLILQDPGAPVGPEFPGEDELQIDSMVVTGSRLEEEITSSRAERTVVEGEALVRTGERSLPRALGEAAGVWIQESNLGGGAPVIRGLLGNQILIVLDGVRLNNSTTRFGPNQILNTIDPAIVERVEILRGSHSVLYGSDAIGGVILIWTKRRTPGGATKKHGIAGELSASYDTATEGWRGAVGLSGANETTGWLAIVGREDWDDLRAGDGEVQEQTGYSGNSFFGSLEFDVDRGDSLRVSAMINRTFNVPRTFLVTPGFGQEEAAFEQYDFALQERELALLTRDIEAPFPGADRMQLRLSARRYTEQRDRRRTGSDTQVFSQTQVETVGVAADFIKDLGTGHRLTYGFDLDRDRVDSFRIDTDRTTGNSTRRDGDFAPGARYDSFGLFVQDEISAWDPYLFTAGLRWSRFDFEFDDPDTGREDGQFDALTASLAAARDLTEDVRLTATLAQGFQAPNLEDLANDGAFAGGVEEANPDLDPARSLMAELAVDVERPLWSTTGALFWTRIDDFLGRRLLDAGDPDVAGDELYLRSNAGEIQLYGVELSANRILGGERSPWSIEAVASWVRGRQYDDTLDPNTGERPLDGVEVRRVPPLNGRVSLLWQDFSEDVWLDEARLSVHWANEQEQLHPEDIGDPRIDPEGSEGWTILNLDLTGPLSEGVRWNLSLINLTDELYRVHGSGVDGPGRSLVFGFRASF